MTMTGNGTILRLRTTRIAAAIAAIIALSMTGALAEEKPITAHSAIDWKLEKINSKLSLDTAKSGIILPTGRNAALQMLEMETPALLKDAFFAVLVDSSSRVGDTVERGELSLSDLNTIIDAGRTTPPAFSTDLKTVSMTHTISLYDLASLYIKGKAPYEPKPPLETAPTRAFTGILIDARGALPVHGEYGSASISPCLFPKLWSTEMDPLFNKSMVMPEIARKRGIVQYSATMDESKYRDLIGNDPLRIVAREIYGKNRTDPVISKDEYLKIVSLESNRKILTEGKVVIICDSAMLDSHDTGIVRDEAWWFIRGEIGAKLEKKPIQGVELTDSWEGLKLMVYDVRFEADTARVLAEERSRLDAIAEALKEAGPDARFMIEGHTANVGKPSGELQLSVERARVIASELAARGIDKDHIGYSGVGGNRPVAPNDTDAGRARNRRVEITITP